MRRSGDFARDNANTVDEDLKVPLQRACRWLISESYVDDRGLRTWHPAALEGASRPCGASARQAWCYGTPGLAWALWQVGQVLNDQTLCNFAEEAMHSFCDAFDEGVYTDGGPADEALSICHGAAGMLAVADAFALYAGHVQAARLRRAARGLPARSCRRDWPARP